MLTRVRFATVLQKCTTGVLHFIRVTFAKTIMLPHNYTVHERVSCSFVFLNTVVTLKYKLILTCVTKSTMHAHGQ